MKSLIWIRGKDLRVHDHDALNMAGPGDVAVFVVDPFFFDPTKARELPHRMQFLLDSLHSLCEDFRLRGGALWTVQGHSKDIIPKLAEACGVDRVIASRWTEPFGRRRDDLVRARLSVPLLLMEGETLHPPGTMRTGAGKPYSVFSPFARSLRSTPSGGSIGRRKKRSRSR